MHKIILYLLYSVFLIISCRPSAKEGGWEKSIDQLQDERTAQLKRQLKIAEKRMRDGGNRPSDTLLYDSLQQIDQRFQVLYAVLESTAMANATSVQDSANFCIGQLDAVIEKILGKNPGTAVDSFQFLKFSNKRVRVRKEDIAEKDLSLYRQTLILEAMELESILLSKKGERLKGDLFDIGTSRFFVIANKDHVQEGEAFKARIVCVTSLPVKKKFVIDGKEYQPDSSGMVEYKVLPDVHFKGNEKYKKKCVKIAFSMDYIGMDTVLTSEYCYVVQRKCSE